MGAVFLSRLPPFQGRELLFEQIDQFGKSHTRAAEGHTHRSAYSRTEARAAAKSPSQSSAARPATKALTAEARSLEAGLESGRSTRPRSRTTLKVAAGLARRPPAWLADRWPST